LDENIRRLRSGVTNLSQVFSDRTNELKRFRDILDNLETLRMHQKEKLDSKITVLKALREERDRVKHQYTVCIHTNTNYYFLIPVNLRLGCYTFQSD
jgi:hypothetical protein